MIIAWKYATNELASAGLVLLIRRAGETSLSEDMDLDHGDSRGISSSRFGSFMTFL